MSKPLHAHTAGDGRGPRDAYLNGKLIEHVLYADERKGVVRVAVWPYRLDKYRKRILVRTLHGTVKVVMGEGDE